MRRLLIGCLVGMALTAPSLWALRIETPPTFHEWNSNTFTQLNNFLLQLWNVSNGKYAQDISTTDPDGSRRGTKGEMVLYDPGASEELCVNVDGATDWDCASLTP